MKLINFEKVKDGKYLKNYELTYLNKVGKEKKYEMVSHNEIHNCDEIGSAVSGVSIVVIKGDKLLLLKEFRMAINRPVFNLCAGMIEPGENITDCVRRELYEETGLRLKEIVDIMPPSFAAVGFSDVKTQIVIAKVCDEKDYTDEHTSDNEEIKAEFYTREQIKELLKTDDFSSRSQMIAYFFAKGCLYALCQRQRDPVRPERHECVPRLHARLHLLRHPKPVLSHRP